MFCYFFFLERCKPDYSCAFERWRRLLCNFKGGLVIKLCNITLFSGKADGEHGHSTSRTLPRSLSVEHLDEAGLQPGQVKLSSTGNGVAGWRRVYVPLGGIPSLGLGKTRSFMFMQAVKLRHHSICLLLAFSLFRFHESSACFYVIKGRFTKLTKNVLI